MAVTGMSNRKAAFASCRKLQKAFASLGCFMLLSSCSKIFPSDTIRFRIDLAIPTIHGVVHGSGVLQGKYERTTWPTRNAFSSTLTGEAILIELPNNAAIIATLNGTLPSGKPSPGIVMLPERLFTDAAIAADPNWEGKREKIVASISAHKGWSKSMTYGDALVKQITEIPFLVYLPDAGNPKTIQALRGQSFLLGEPHITVTITDEKISTGLMEKLPWINELIQGETRVSGRKVFLKSQVQNIQDELGAGSFTTELK